MFEWQKQYLTSEMLFLTREHKSIPSRDRLMFCLLYGLIQSEKNTRKVKCFRCISNGNFVLYTNGRPFVFSKQQQ
jgi:hypothetical protein